MSDEWDGWRRVLGTRDLDDMEVIGTGMFSVGVPVDADPEFKTYVFAAAHAHAMGNRSIDYQLRKNYDEWMIRHSDKVLLKKGSQNALLRAVRDLADSRCLALSNLSLGSATEGELVAANTLIRLESTFRAAVQLVRLNFPFEAEAMLRLALEQIGWAHIISRLAEPKIIRTTKVTSGTAGLKQVFPGAGHIYGRLTDSAHMALHTHSRVLKNEGERVKIEIKSPDASRESALYLILLVDAFLAVGERCFAGFGLQCSTTREAGSTLRDDRPALRLISEYVSILPPNTEEIVDKWWRPGSR